LPNQTVKTIGKQKRKRIVSANRIHSIRGGGQFKLCAVPHSLFKGNISVADYASIYTSQGIENDASAMIPNLDYSMFDVWL